MPDREHVFSTIFRDVRNNECMGNYEIHPLGILIPLLIGFVFGLMLFGIIGGALFGVLALSSYILTVQSLDSEPKAG